MAMAAVPLPSALPCGMFTVPDQSAAPPPPDDPSSTEDYSPFAFGLPPLSSDEASAYTEYRPCFRPGISRSALFSHIDPASLAFFYAATGFSRGSPHDTASSWPRIGAARSSDATFPPRPSGEIALNTGGRSTAEDHAHFDRIRNQCENDSDQEVLDHVFAFHPPPLDSDEEDMPFHTERTFAHPYAGHEQGGGPKAHAPAALHPSPFSSLPYSQPLHAASCPGHIPYSPISPHMDAASVRSNLDLAGGITSSTLEYLPNRELADAYAVGQEMTVGTSLQNNNVHYMRGINTNSKCFSSHDISQAIA